jgi:uncharacterized protein (DUF1015 family)
VPHIHPFAALRPASGRAIEVVAPPYDVVSTEQARARAANRPWSFLHVSKPEIDLPQGTDPYSPAVYAKGKENFSRMLTAGVLKRDGAPALYAYRITAGDHVQTGLAAAASVADYDANRIRKHEFTRPDKEDDRVRHMEALNAQTGPALVAYPAAAEVDELLAATCSQKPESDAIADDRVRHSIWPIRDARIIRRMGDLFAAMPALYIADGHHRSAAASRVAAARRRVNPRSTGEESHESFLIVAFPHHELRILAYNRVVRDLAGMSPAAFLAKLGEGFTIAPSAGPVAPGRRGELGLYTDGSWLRLSPRAEASAAADPIQRLDVSLLTARILAPILRVGDLRTDKRVDFVGGGHGLGELQRRVDSGEMAAAFSLYPTSLEDLMAVADAGGVMPPKSTWFEPKLADGLLSHVLD